MHPRPSFLPLGQRVPTAEVLREGSEPAPSSDFTPDPGFSPFAYFWKAALRPGTYEREIATRVLIVGAAVVVAIVITRSLSGRHSGAETTTT